MHADTKSPKRRGRHLTGNVGGVDDRLTAFGSDDSAGPLQGSIKEFGRSLDLDPDPRGSMASPDVAQADAPSGFIVAQGAQSEGPSSG